MSRGLPHVARPVSRIEGSEAGYSSGFFACTCVFTGSGQGGKEMNENAPERRVRQGMDYGEDSDVHQVHAAIQREKREPRVGLEPLSIWLIAVYGLAIFFGGAYLGRFSGNFSGDSLDPILIPSAKKTAAGGPVAGQQAHELSPAERAKKFCLANC